MITRNYQAFVTRLQELDLLEVCSLKPLTDGKALAKALQASPGPWMKEALDVVMAWQLRNPDTATSQGAIEEVRNSKLHGELTANLISHFLRLTIRPLFAKSQHPAVTSQGRKVTTNVLPRRFAQEESEEVAKPWKYHDSYAMSLLRWIVQNLDERQVEQNWPMLVPPILSITDDYDTKMKAQGCQFVEALLQVTPASLLARTGLSDVFKEALLPCLGYLPTLTAEDESITLLSAVYPALIVLSRSAHHPTSKTTPEEMKEKRAVFLDSIMRKGILAAYAHCPENIKIVEVLLHNLVLLLDELGVESVKHLKYILPMLNEVLTNPFGTTYPPLLLAGIKAMQSVVLNAWPRMAANKGEVLKGLTICWLLCEDAQRADLGSIKAELVTTAQMLRQAVGTECDFDADTRALIAADQRLTGLLESAT